MNRNLLLLTSNRSLALSIKLSSRSLPPCSSPISNPRISSGPSPSRFPALTTAPPRSRHRSAVPSFSFSSSLPPSNPFSPLLSLSLSHTCSHSPPQNRLASSAADPKDGAFHLWDRPVEGGDKGDLGVCGERGEIWTVVLLGWLGAEHRHLKRYAEIYNAKGIQSVRFVVLVRELFGLDLGRRVEDRIAKLTRELVSWCSEAEKDGREPRLLFHTFSNTGWLAYGSIIENLQSRSDILEKIKGCVVDSGPAPEINPQVWAAGFCAALLKKHSSLTYPSVEPVEGGKLDGNNSRSDIRPPLSEIIFLSILEKFFSIVLKLPDVNQRLRRIISILSKNQPACPQLYLYSSADKVIRVHSVESFIEKQKALGRKVLAHDFVSSPHVDHLRNCPHIYSAKIDEFLKETCNLVVSKTI